MYNYKVNATGHVDLDSKESLIFLKLFPYVLATFALLGSFTKVMWELYDRYGYSLVSTSTSEGPQKNSHLVGHESKVMFVDSKVVES